MEAPKRPLETFITLILEGANPALSEAHRELYPERIPERISFSLTLLYPWIPTEDVGEGDLARLRTFFVARAPLAFDLVRVEELEGRVAYVVPEPDEELRSLMRALWSLYPAYPPYGIHGHDPPPHATLGRLQGDAAITLAQARERAEPLLPVHCHISEATLMEEFERDRWRVWATFPFAGPAVA